MFGREKVFFFKLGSIQRYNPCHLCRVAVPSIFYSQNVHKILDYQITNNCLSSQQCPKERDLPFPEILTELLTEWSRRSYRTAVPQATEETPFFWGLKTPTHLPHEKHRGCCKTKSDLANSLSDVPDANAFRGYWMCFISFCLLCVRNMKKASGFIRIKLLVRPFGIKGSFEEQETEQLNKAVPCQAKCMTSGLHLTLCLFPT